MSTDLTGLTHEVSKCVATAVQLLVGQSGPMHEEEFANLHGWAEHWARRAANAERALTGVHAENQKLRSKLSEAERQLSAARALLLARQRKDAQRPSAAILRG
jgi:predicted  nucleic acid-binding Zn-ribbon protein